MKLALTMLATLSILATAACGNGGGGSQQPSCTPGEFGCACLSDDTCGQRDGQPLICVSAVCVEDPNANNAPDAGNNDPNPDAGNNDPDPDAGNNNNNNNMGFTGLGLAVGDDAARACEALLLDPERRIDAVTFPQGVEGRFQRRGQKVALAFSATSDAALAEGSATFSLSEGAANLDGVTVTQDRCFDRQGAAIDGAGLQIVDRR